MPSLTQHEAQERAALIEVRRYDIAVDLTDLLEGPEVRCTSAITFGARVPGSATFVDCAAEVVRATLDGVPVGAVEDGRILLTDLGRSSEHVLVIETVQRNTATGEGVHRAVDPADGEVYLWTSFEPDEARFVWACFDQPDLKAPHRFTVTAPAAWTVFSNSGDAEIADAADGARRWTFADTPPLSTYNPVVLAGPFHEVRRRVGGHDLGLACRRSLAPILERDADNLFTVTAQGLAFFGDEFAMPFPQARYDQVFLPDFGGAMENYGCVAWADTFLFRSDATPAEEETRAKVLLHEMAHMWFGNIVTMRWWDDLWLNEAFAEFACNWAAVNATAYTDSWASHLADDKIDAYLADQGPTSHPIHQPIADVEQAASIFDSITYPKGASVLDQLRTYVGPEAFRVGMRAYFARRAWGNTTLGDLMDALAEASGRDLDAWREAWLSTAGTDRLTLTREGDGLVLSAVPSGDVEGAPHRPHVTTVGAYRRGPSGLERIAVERVEVAADGTALDLPEADLLLVNDEDLTFATSRPDERSRPVLLAEAAALPTALARGVAVATVWDLLCNGEASAAETVDALARVVVAESAASVVEPYLRMLADAAELWAPEEQRRDLQAVAARACRTLAAEPVRREVALRTLARCADGEDLTWLRDQVGDHVDLGWRFAARAAELGEDTDAAVAELLARDPDPDAWVRALVVRAAKPDAAAKAEVWTALLEERRVPIGMAGQVGTAFWRAGQDDLVAPYAERFLAALPRLDDGGMIPAMVLTYRLFPTYAIDAVFLDRVEATLAQAAPVVASSARERGDHVRRMLRSRAG